MKTIYTAIVLFCLVACTASKEWINNNSTISEHLHDIEVLNDKVAWTYSYGTGHLYQTNNGGKNWTNIYRFDSIYFEQLQFLDAQQGWLIGSPNKIYKTTDGGHTWTERALTKEATKAYLYGMYFENPTTGYIAALGRGKQGFFTKIFKTENAGEDWIFVHQLDEMILNLESIEESLYGSGKNVIIKNIEQKNNWSYLFQDTSKVVGDIRDIAKQNNKIYAVSFNGYFIETEALQQSSISKITSNRLRHFILTNKEWIAVGDNNKEKGNVFVSKDKGKNWTLSPTPLPDVHRIQQSKNKMWLVGKEGLVMNRSK